MIDDEDLPRAQQLWWEMTSERSASSVIRPPALRMMFVSPVFSCRAQLEDGSFES
jgi:hypothetical protein